MEKLNKIFRTSEIAAIDKYTIEHEPVSSLDLMERAARVWTEFFLKKFGTGFRVCVVAGHGNNGGDGYAIARLLREKGVEVRVFRLAGDAAASADCDTNRARYMARGGDVADVCKTAGFDPQEDEIIVDALFGTGLSRPAGGLAAGVIRKMNLLPNCVVAVDMPSGLMGEDNSGNDPAAIVQADYTFTFQFPKVAFMLAENALYVGEWSVLDIGLHPEIIGQTHAAYYYLTERAVRNMLPRPPKFAHKGTNGRGLLVAGAKGMMGAAVLAAKAAVRSGVGLLYCHVPEAGRDVVQIAAPEALIDVDESESVFSGVKNTSGYDAVAAGPALGRAPETVEGLKRLLAEWRGVTILDADALNILSEHRELLDLLHEGCVLTPHVKEFERLAGKCENDFERLNKLSTFARRYKICVLLKGAHSVVASPAGICYFNMSGNPGMAKGGAGDVLTGVLLALAANGLPPLQAAVAGMYAHGLAGDLLASEFGKRGISAGMIAEGMGRAWKILEEYRVTL